MTIEEKAKAYDKVREKIALRFGSNVAEEIFSVFEESEDERIRKWIIDELKDSLNTIRSIYSGDYDNRDKDDILRESCLTKGIAWLEKQGEQKSLGDIVKEVTKNKETAMSFLKSYGIMNANGELADEYKTEHGEQKSAVPLDENGEPILTDFESALFTAISCFWQSYNLGEEVNIAEFVKEYAPELLEAANKQQNIMWWIIGGILAVAFFTWVWKTK